MIFQSIQSGSNGNCCFCAEGETGILIDDGISQKKLLSSLAALSFPAERIKGIFITHEHSDHISGLPSFAVNYRIPIYGNRETLSEIHYKYHKIPEGLFCEIAGETVIDRLKVTAVEKPHDAVRPVAYRIASEKNCAVVLTDLGHVTEDLCMVCADADLLLLECNHNVRMLEVGNYPYFLKQRILGPDGHLSNEQAADFLNETGFRKLRYLLLGHLSHEHNTSELALLTVESGWNPDRERKPEILIASRTEASPVLFLD